MRENRPYGSEGGADDKRPITLGAGLPHPGRTTDRTSMLGAGLPTAPTHRTEGLRHRRETRGIGAHNPQRSDLPDAHVLAAAGPPSESVRLPAIRIGAPSVAARSHLTVPDLH
jgi:hypothetical protein